MAATVLTTSKNMTTDDTDAYNVDADDADTNDNDVDYDMKQSSIVRSDSLVIKMHLWWRT